MVDLSVDLCGMHMDNPVVPASGTFGFGNEFKDFYDINILGSFSFKGTTKDARFGNPTPRIAECKNGMINAVGLQNPGVQHVINFELPQMKKYFHKKVIANVSGFSVDDYAYTCSLLDKEEQVGILEVNVSCPNVHGGGMSFGTNPECAAEVTRAVKAVTTKPVFIKLSPNVTDIVSIAKACEEAGADGICLINTLLGMRVDTKKRAAVIANKMGGFSGDAIFPVAVRMVYQVSKACNIPVMGCGGVSSASDVIEMMMAGATAVQVGVAEGGGLHAELLLDHGRMELHLFGEILFRRQRRQRMGVGFGQKLDASRGGQLLERVEHLRREGAELLDGDARDRERTAEFTLVLLDQLQQQGVHGQVTLPGDFLHDRAVQEVV